MAYPTETTNTAASQLAADIDLRCALAFGRAALQALSDLSGEARAAALQALDQEAVSAAMDGGPESAAVTAVIDEARQRLAKAA